MCNRVTKIEQEFSEEKGRWIYTVLTREDNVILEVCDTYYDAVAWVCTYEDDLDKVTLTAFAA